MSRTAELTVKLLDSTLSEAECAELEALIAADPAAEAEHLALLELEVELRGLRTDLDLADATLTKIADAQADRTADAVLDQIATAPLPTWARSTETTETTDTAAPSRPVDQLRQPRSRFRLWIGVGVLAACAATLLLVFLNNQDSQLPLPIDDTPTPTAFAKLSRKAGSVELLSPTGDVIPAIEGGDLPAGFTVRTVGDESLAVVELLNEKTRVEIEPDSVVRFAGGSPESPGKPRVFLAAGQLTAAVPHRPDDQPMIVGTSVAELFTREGTFVLSSAGPDSVRVDIKHGKVDVVRNTAPKPVRLDAGRAAVLFAGIDQLDIEHAQPIDRAPKRTLTFPGARDIAFSPDGSEIWVANARAFARWPANGNPVETSFYPRKGNDGIAAITRNKKFLVAFRGERDDRVLIRTLPDGGEHAALNARPSDPRFWAVAPNAAWLAVVDPRPNNKRVHIIDGARGDERFDRPFEEGMITCVAATPNGKNLAVGIQSNARGAGNKIVVIDAVTSDQFPALPLPKRPLMAMTFSPDSHVLAAGFNGTVQLWDWQNLELIRSINGFERALVCLAFSPDGKRLAAATQDGHVWLWNVDTGRQTQLIDVGSRGIRTVAFSPNGKQLVTLTGNAAVAVWDVVDRTLPLANVQ
jgi:WD40 repeat protein